MIDAKVKLIADAPRPMKHNARVSFHSHVSETGARIRLLDARQLQPGNEAWAQIHLTNPLPLVKGDFFVVRSTETTIGGGKVVDPFPRRHRPFTASVLKSLQAMDEGTLEELILGAVEQWAPCDLTALAQRSNLTLADVRPVIDDLAKQGGVALLGGSKAGPGTQIYSRGGWQRLKRQCASTLKDYHDRNPLRRGIPKEEFRNRLGVSAAGFPQLLARLVDEKLVDEDGAVVRSPGYEATLTPAQNQAAQTYIAQLDANPFSPPTDANVSPELLALLIDRKQVVKVDASVVFSADAYLQMVQAVTRPHRRPRKHHRRRSPHPAGLQPQVHPPPPGIPRPTAPHPPHRRQTRPPLTLKLHLRRFPDMSITTRVTRQNHNLTLLPRSINRCAHALQSLRIAPPQRVINHHRHAPVVRTHNWPRTLVCSTLPAALAPPCSTDPCPA